MNVRFSQSTSPTLCLLISLMIIGCCGNASAQTSEASSSSVAIEDYSQLTKPEIAAAINLSDEQKALIQQLVTERDTATAAAEETARPAIVAASNEKLKSVLTPDQQRLFASLFVGKTLRFNFRNQKWADVLDWISKEADLSLVMDTPPPGTFHYSDSKDYSTTDAIDLLNGWLLTKGFTLVRRERMLMCLDLKGGLPEGAIPRVTLEELATRGRYEFVSVLIPLEGRPADSVLLEVKPLLGSYGKAEPLAQTQQLLVFDTAANLRVVEQIVKKVPIPQKPAAPPVVEPPKPVLTIYPIEHANPAQAGEVLKAMVAGTVVTDQKARQISVNAIPTEQDKAKAIIAQLESNQGPDMQPKLQLYSVQVSDADQMLATLKLIAPDGQYRIDSVSGKLIAWASEKDHAHISESLQMIQADQPQSGVRQLQVYALTNAEPTAVSTILATVVPTSRIAVNTTTRSLIAVGTLADHEAIRALIEQLEAQTESAATERVLKTYPASSAIATTIVTLMTTAVPKAQVLSDTANQRLLVMATADEHARIDLLLKSLETAENTGKQLKIHEADQIDTVSVIALLTTLTPQAAVTVDAVNKRLLVVASEQDQAKVADVLNQARIPEAASLRSLKSYPLQPKITSATIITLLTTLAPRASVTPDEVNRRLLITATKDEHVLVDQVIQQVQNDAIGIQPELRFYPLKKVSGTTSLAILQSIAPLAKITFQADANRYSVIATGDDHAAIAAMLEQLETGSADIQRDLKFYDVSAIGATDARTLLVSTFTDVIFVATAEGNKLMAWVSPDQDARIRATLEQLATEHPFQTTRKMELYSITDLGPTATTVLAQAVPTATITAGARADQLAIVATAVDHEKLKKVLEQLQTTKVLPELRFYPLKKVSGTTSLAILQSIAPLAKITFQADANRYSVIATGDDHAAIAAMLEQLETGSADIQRDLKFYDVSAIGATDARTLLVSTFTDVIFVATAEGNKLMAWVSPDQDARIRATLEQLATEHPFQTTRKMELYSITDLGPTATTVLAQAVPTATITAGARADQLAIVATAVDHEKLKKVLEQLQTTKVSPELRFYPLKKVSGTTSLAILQSIVPLAKITFQADANRYSVIATNDDHKAIAATLEHLETGSADVQRELKFYDVSIVGAADTRTLLASTFADVTFLTTAEGSKLMAWVSPDQDARIRATLEQLATEQPFQTTRKMELYTITGLGPTATTVLAQAVPMATITAGARSDQLAIVATATDHEKLKKVLLQLEDTKSFPPEKSLVVHQITGVAPASVLQVLQPLVDADVQLTVDSTGQQLFVRAYSHKHEQINTVINQITATLSESGIRSTKTYVVGQPNADEAQEALAALYPDAKIVTDSDRKILIVTATDEQHATIAQIAAQMKGALLDGDQPVPAVYSLKNASATEVQALLQSMYSRFNNVRLSVNEKTGRLVVLALKEQHDAIRPLIEQLDGESEAAANLELAVFRLNQLDGLAVQQALQPLLPKTSQVTADRIGRLLIVSAETSDMPAIRDMVQKMISSQGTAEGLETRSYRLRPLEADKAQEVLAKLFPDATLVTDVSKEMLVATATAQQHETITKVVQQMTNAVPDGNSPQAIAYPLKAADGENAVEVFEALFTRADNVRLSFDEKTRSLIAVARPEQHKAIKGLIDQLEPGQGDVGARTLEIYALPTVDGLTAVEVAKGVLQSIDRSATVSWEKTSKQLIVSTTAAGHREVNSAVERFQQSDPREMDVIQLRILSASSAQNAIEGLYGDSFAKDGDYPVIQADEDSQQLLVRGSKKQLQDIRTLLLKMGESGLSIMGDSGEPGNRNLRVIPIQGDIEPTLQKIQDLWPRMRRNPMRILRPDGETQPTVPEPKADGQFSVPAESLSTKEVADESGKADDKGTPVGESQNLPAPAPTNQAPVAQPADAPTAARAADELAPVIMISGPGRITIASDDTAALDQLESILRATSSRPGGTAGNRNRDFSVYQLRNAGAEEVAESLKSIYESRAGVLAFGSVVIVPEPRMNALIVYGGRTDRDRIEQLLEILDTEKLPDSGRIFRTQVIPLEHADAKKVETVLKGVYRTEMTAGGSRRAIEIPAGIDSSVANMLRQINAAASAPLLTIEVQVETNSLVVKAPQNLIEELSELVTQLDETSATNRARGVTLIPLKQTNTRRVMRILDDVLD